MMAAERGAWHSRAMPPRRRPRRLPFRVIVVRIVTALVNASPYEEAVPA